MCLRIVIGGFSIGIWDFVCRTARVLGADHRSSLTVDYGVGIYKATGPVSPLSRPSSTTILVFSAYRFPTTLQAFKDRPS